MAAQVDGSWCDVYVHEVVDYSALNVVLDPVHKVSTAHIEDLYVGEFPDQIYGIEDKKKNKKKKLWKYFLCILIITGRKVS